MKKKNIISYAGCTLAMISVISMFSGTAVHAETEGYKLKEQTQQYQYNVASVSKTFAAVAVMQLVDAGKLDLDMPLTTYIPEFKMADERYQKITPRMLLNHTSGLMGTHYLNETLLGEKSNVAKKQLLTELQGEQLKAEPGSYAVYCNDGFTLAEILVERVSGLSFSEYLEKNICEPLQMENTTDSFSKKQPKVPLAQNYYNNTIKIPKEYQSETGSGGVHATSEDLCKLGTLFIGKENTVLYKKSAAEMMENTYAKTSYLRVEGDNSEAYGLGFDRTELYPFNQYGIKAVSKGGDLNYEHANLTILPDNQMVVATVSTGGSSTFNALVSQAVLLAALEVKGEIPEGAADTKSAIAVAKEYAAYKTAKVPEEYKAYAGFYMLGDTLVEVSFSEETMCITTVQTDTPITQTYRYTENDYFVGELGNYISSELKQASAGETGVSRIRLKQETDGLRYMEGNTYLSKDGIGTSALADRVAIKVEAKEVPNEVKKAWQSRIGKTYLLMNANYASGDYSASDGKATAVTLADAGLDGYYKTKAGSMFKVQEMQDANHSKTASIGRDMNRVSAEVKDGIEYLTLEDSGQRYQSEAALLELPEKNTIVTFTEGDKAIWYKVSEKTEKKKAAFQITGKGNVYVYDKYHTLTYSTQMENMGETAILPKEGYLAFVAEPSTTISIKY